MLLGPRKKSLPVIKLGKQRGNLPYGYTFVDQQGMVLTVPFLKVAKSQFPHSVSLFVSRRLRDQSKWGGSHKPHPAHGVGISCKWLHFLFLCLFK